MGEEGLERSFIGVEMEGGHTRAGDEEAPPQANVVRLPRDWIGPREDLVPFGPRANMASPAPPPAAEDFWGGERSAAIHDAVQAPAEHWSEPAQPRGLRLGRRVVVAAAAVGLAIVAATIVLSGGFGVSGSPHRALGGSKVSVAAVLSSGVSRILKLGLPQIDVKASAPRARIAARTGGRARPRPARHTQHLVEAVRVRTAVTSVQPVSSEVAPAAPVSTYHPSETVTHTETSSSTDTQSSPVRSTSASAPANATGESGALGPIQSPNG